MQQPRSSFAKFYENRSYAYDLKKLEKPYLDAYMKKISKKSVHRFKRSRKCV